MSKMIIIDLNVKSLKCHTSSNFRSRKGMAHELWENHFCSAHGFLARSRVSAMCRKIPRPLQDQIFCRQFSPTPKTDYGSLYPTGQRGRMISGFPTIQPSPIILHFSQNRCGSIRKRIRSTGLPPCRFRCTLWLAYGPAIDRRYCH